MKSHVKRCNDCMGQTHNKMHANIVITKKKNDYNNSINFPITPVNSKFNQR